MLRPHPRASAVHVAQRDDLDRRDLDQAEQVGLSVPARADEADTFANVAELLCVGQIRPRQMRLRPP